MGETAEIAELDHCYAVVGEMLEYFDGYTLATWAPLASIIQREITRARATPSEGDHHDQ